MLDGLRQEGCLKARFPRREPGSWAGAVMLNSSGGVAGGDRLAVRIAAGADTQATVASQAAERFYRALPGTRAEVGTTIGVGPGAALEWLPQETILFDRSAVRRRLCIDLAEGAQFLGVESLLFGRAAMGEAVQEAAIDDGIELRHAGKLVLHERVRLVGEGASGLARAAGGVGARGVATVIVAGRGAEAPLDALRAALAPFDAGASAMDGVLLARIVAQNGACLRMAVVAALNVLRGGRSLPRVWLC